MSSRSRAFVIAAIAIGCAAFAIRFWIARAQPVWRDEAQTIAIARLASPAAIIDALRVDGNAPLFYLLEHPFVADARRPSPGRELQDRAISILFGVIAVVQSMLLARRLSGGSVSAGVLAGIVMAVAPIAVESATQARPYAALTVAGLAMTHFAISERPGWIGYCLAATAAVYLQPAAAGILVVAFGLALLLASDFRRWLVTHAVIALLSLAEVIFFAHQVQRLTLGGRFIWGVDRPIAAIVRRVIDSLAGASSGVYLYAILSLLALLWLAAGLRRGRAIRVVAVATSIAIACSVIVARLTGAVEARYNVVITTLFLIVACCGVAALPRMRSAAVVVIGILYCCFVVFDTGAFTSTRSSVREVAAYLGAHSTPADRIIVVPQSLAVALNYYLPATPNQINPPASGRVEWLDFTPRPYPDRAAAIDARNQTVWLIVSEPMMRSLSTEAATNPVLNAQWNYVQRVIAEFERVYGAARPVRFTTSVEPAVVFRGGP